MYSLHVHQDAEDDLDGLDAKVAAQIVVLLEDLSDNQDLLDRLSQHKFRDQDIDVERLGPEWNFGPTFNTLWRLKDLDLERRGIKYRIIYAYLPRKSKYHVLAIVPRDFDYDPNHPISKRIFEAFGNL